MVINRIIIVIALGILCSCYPSKRLQNGRKVLAKKYKNIDKFDRSIFSKIDPDYFYKEMESYRAGSDFKHVVDYWDGPSGGKLQFYENGRIRFLSDKIKESPDPEVSGGRGIIYLNNDAIRVEAQSADQDGTLSKQTLKVIVEGDKIYLVEILPLGWLKLSNPWCFVYQKAEKVPEDWKKYKADW